jgi:hypothetical protein
MHNIYSKIVKKNPDLAYNFQDKWSRLYDSSMNNFLNLYPEFKKYYGSNYIDTHNRDKQLLSPTFWYDIKIKPSHLPESYLKEIDTLAERILGEQYGKYLK